MDGVARQNPPGFALDVQRTTRGASRTLSKQRPPPTGNTKENFEQKVAKVTKGNELYWALVAPAAFVYPISPCDAILLQASP